MHRPESFLRLLAKYGYRQIKVTTTGGRHNFTFMQHEFLVLTVKKLLKSVSIYGSYRKNKTGVPFFWTTLYIIHKFRAILLPRLSVKLPCVHHWQNERISLWRHHLTDKQNLYHHQSNAAVCQTIPARNNQNNVTKVSWWHGSTVPKLQHSNTLSQWKEQNTRNTWDTEANIKNRYQKAWSIWNVVMEKDGKDQLDTKS